MHKIVFAVAMPSTTLTYVNLSTLYRETNMLMKQTPKPSGSSMCYNRTVMVVAGLMCTVLLFPHSHSWLQLVALCGISDTSVAGSNSLPALLMNVSGSIREMPSINIVITSSVNYYTHLPTKN